MRAISAYDDDDDEIFGSYDDEDDEVDDEDDITLGQNLLSVLKGVGVVVLILALVVIAMRALEVIASRVEGFSFDCEWFRDHLGKVGQFLFPRA